MLSHLASLGKAGEMARLNKQQIPRSNIQHPEKLQISNSKTQELINVFGAWNLELLWILDVGGWSFKGQPTSFGLLRTPCRQASPANTPWVSNKCIVRSDRECRARLIAMCDR